MLDFGRFSWLSFDCYGTLIDWESGILKTLRALLAAHQKTAGDAEILALYAHLESAAERGVFRPYRQVLTEVVCGFGREFGFEPAEEKQASLAESLGDWRPFPDTVAALGRLKGRYRLAIISNVDDDLFAATARHLQVPLDAVITAQQAMSYKPSRRNFELALERMGVGPKKVLHVAQSLFHDVATARSLGMATVWVNRASRAMPGRGATPAATAQPDLEVPDLATLAQLAAS